MTITLHGTTVTWTGDAAQPGVYDAFDVTLRVTPSGIEYVRPSPFLDVEEEARALRAMVRELAELVAEQAAEIEGLEAEMEES